jgi:hypothetical protein
VEGLLNLDDAELLLYVAAPMVNPHNPGVIMVLSEVQRVSRRSYGPLKTF